jgi:5-methylcytosine-specific restriction endonuclease McrA
MAKTPYACSGWRKVRRYVLARDNFECQVREPGCKRIANVADHVRPWKQGGAWLDPTNLRASCKSCNTARGNRGRFASGFTAPPSREW